MLFKEKKLNCIKYQFEHEPLENEIYSYDDLAKELSCLSECLLGYETVELMGQQTIYVSDIKQIVLERTYHDIKNILCHKNDFKRRLETIGIFEPEKNTMNFKYYLQFVYFFYIMIYFVYPKQRFMDIFLEKNWSAENITESDIGMERYEQFILNHLYQNKRIESTYKTRLQQYDDEWSLAQDTFFCLYEYLYNEMYKESYSKENMESFQTYFSSVLKNIDDDIDKTIVLKENRNVFDSFFDFLSYYQSTALNKDMKYNLEHIDFTCLKQIYDKIKIPIQNIEKRLLKKEEIESFLMQPDFICACMNVDHITNSIVKKYESYALWDCIEKTWKYEQEQMELYPIGDGFTFLIKENEYKMSSQDIFILAMLKIYLPTSISYKSKRLYLNNRSDSIKKEEHSIKYSYTNKKNQEMDVSNSAARDDYFRICARCIQSMVINENSDEFLFFELPMNIQLFEFMAYANGYPQVEMRTEYFKKFNE